MQSKIALVGEAYGEQEEIARAPFVGSAGWELNKMLDEAGIHRADCFITNVFNLRPRPTNDIKNLCTDKSGGLVHLGPLQPSLYLRPEYAVELSRLHSELAECQPNVIVTLGATATWALCGTTGITKIRGTITQSRTGRKVLPTFHPSAVQRDWSLRTVTVLDLAKAKRESAFLDIRRPERLVYIEPSLNEMDEYFRTHLEQARELSFDIETARDQITCIGFAPDDRTALVVPFHDARKADGNYWQTRSEELAAWAFVRKVLLLPCPKFGQNTLYDINFLWTKYRMIVNNYSDDTMLLHHALQPESQKGLAFLGSVYTNEASWKLMRNKGPKTIKKDN